LTPDDFLLVKEASPISKVSPPTSSSSKKTSLSKKKKKALMKAFLESLDVGYDEDEEESDAFSEATINPQRESLAILELILKNIFLDLKIYELKNFSKILFSFTAERFTQDLFSCIVEDFSDLKIYRFSC
jgi:hypothetical protein